MAEPGAVAIATAVRTGEVRAAEVIEAALARAHECNPALNALTEVTAARARAEAAAVDAAHRAGRDPGPLAGVPYVVKNLFDVEGRPTLAGSRIGREGPPAARDAALVARLRTSGAVLLGTTNMDEYAYGFTTENAHYGATRNPHDPSRSAGGSSGGSAAAVAAGVVPIALGTDTNGSIRVPASVCGIFGLKPTFGRLSRRGVFPFVASLDHAGPLAACAADLAAVYDALQAYDPADPAAIERRFEPVSTRLERGVEGLRIAVAVGHFRQCGPAALDAVERAAAALGASRTVDLAESDRARAAAFVITTAEGAQVHLESLRGRPDDFDPLVRDRLRAGALVPAAWYLRAQRFRRWYRERVAEHLREVDVILAPATPVPAQPLGRESIDVGGQTLPLRSYMGWCTQPLTLTGFPVAVAPVRRDGTRAGLPIGVQILAAPWREDRVLRVASVLEACGIAVVSPPPTRAAGR